MFNFFFCYGVVKLLFFDLLNLNNSVYLSYILNLNSWNYNVFYFSLMIFFFLNSKLFSKNTYIFLLANFKVSIITNLFNYIKQFNMVSSLLIGSITLHPFLFYFVIVLVICKSLNMFKWHFLNVLAFRFFFIFKLGAFSLMLGGLWGLQSVTWGFVWVNDTIEWLFLYLLIFIIYFLHKTFLHNIFFFCFFLFIYLNFLLGIRLNFFSSRHSFFSKTAVNTVILVSIFFSITNLYYNFNIKRIVYCVKLSIQIIYVFFFFLLSFLIHYLTLKYFFMILIFWGIDKLNKKYLLHFFIFLFYFMFNYYINLFFIKLKFYEFIEVNSVSVFTNVLATKLPIQLNFFKDFLLEKVVFNLRTYMYINFLLLKNLIELLFNNLNLILYFFLINFLKRDEFRLLYKKKTYI